jgi:hypothetical protein
MEVQLHAFVSSALEGYEWLAPSFGPLPLEENAPLVPI